VQAAQQGIKALFLGTLVVALVACGGGGSDSPPPPPPAPAPEPEDSTPDAFSFTPAIDVALGAQVTSGATVINGIDTAVPISISGGEYAIDGGGFTATAGTILAGQSVVVRVTAPNQFNATAEAVLTIGGIEGTFAVNTVQDRVHPTVEFKFPPPVSMTEGDSILVRGVGFDDYSGIDRLEVNGIVVEDIGNDGFSNWQVVVPLAPMQDNTVTVMATDAAGNSSSAEITVRQGPGTASFPDSLFPIEGPVDILVDRTGGNRLLVVDGGRFVTSVDVETAERTRFADLEESLSSLALDEEAQQLYVTYLGDTIFRIGLSGEVEGDVFNYHVPSGIHTAIGTNDGQFKIAATEASGDAVISINPETEEREVISSASSSVPDAETPLESPFRIAADATNQRYLVTSSTSHTIYAVDWISGARTVFSSPEVGSGDPFDPSEQMNGDFLGLAVCEETQSALVADAPGRIISIDLSNGHRTLLSPGDSENEVVGASSIAVDTCEGYAYIGDRESKSILAVDLVTGHRVIFSKSDTP
jgi:hypothetical protein